MEIQTSTDHLSQVLSSQSLVQLDLSLEHGIELSLRTVLQNEIEVFVILIMVVQLHNVFVIQIVHNLHLQLNLLHQVVLNDLRLVDHLDSEDIF